MMMIITQVGCVYVCIDIPVTLSPKGQTASHFLLLTASNWLYIYAHSHWFMTVEMTVKASSLFPKASLSLHFERSCVCWIWESHIRFFFLVSPLVYLHQSGCYYSHLFFTEAALYHWGGQKKKQPYPESFILLLSFFHCLPTGFRTKEMSSLKTLPLILTRQRCEGIMSFFLNVWIAWGGCCFL